MNEFQRFMRYVLPGLATLFMFVFFTCFSDQQLLLEWVGRLSKASGGSSLGVGVTAFLVSGALGYILSALYWALVWWKPIAKRLMNQFRDLLGQVEEKIEIIGVDDEVIRLSKIDERGAWEIIALWAVGYEEENKRAAGQSRLQSRLVNINHSYGTTFVGMFIALIFWIVLQAKKCALFNDGSVDGWYTLLIIGLTLAWVGVLLALRACYRQTRRSLLVIAHSGFLDSIEDVRSSSPPHKTKIRYVRL